MNVNQYDYYTIQWLRYGNKFKCFLSFTLPPLNWCFISCGKQRQYLLFRSSCSVLKTEINTEDVDSQRTTNSNEFSFERFIIPKPNYHLLAQINLKYDDCLSQCNWCRTDKSQVWTEFGIWMKASRHRHHHHHHAYCVCVCFDGDLLCTLFIPFRFDHHLKKR